MSRMRVAFRSIALLGLVAAACAPMQVHTYVPRGADLGRFDTYAWATAGEFATGDPRLDNNTLFMEHLQSAVERQLARKGWVRGAAREADLVIHVHARIDQRFEVTPEPGPMPASHDSAGPLIYDAGTLLLDFVDSRSNALVWRGWAEGSVEGLIDNQAWMNEKIDAAVSRILDTFPAS